MENICFAGERPRLSSGEEEMLFAAGMSYLASGAPEAALFCFNQLASETVPTVFNKALCCYLTKRYAESRRLLGEAARLSTGRLPGRDLLFSGLPGPVLDRCLHRCPMPQGAPPALVTAQVLRLQAEVAFRLRLYGEVRQIAAGMQKPDPHLEVLLKRIDHEME